MNTGDSDSAPRQLVICLDGTGNRFGERPSNILRVYRALGPACVTYYDQGVGTFGLRETLFDWQNLPVKVLGLAFGWGLRRQVEGAYRFLCDNYRPGDEVYLFGFSRGAYAARALAATVMACGLLSAHETHLFDYAWTLLRKRSGPGKKPPFQLLKEFKECFGRDASIHFLGLFDTVKSVGWIYDPLVLPYTANNPIVRTVRHALAIDERRCFFRQHRWGEERAAGQDVSEIWFAGVHSDVGGGYPPGESQLAKIPLRWMLGEAIAAGLAVDMPRFREQLGTPEEYANAFRAEMHDSMKGAWWLAEWLPGYRWVSERLGRRLTIGAMPPLRAPRPRTIRDGAQVHETAAWRMQSAPYTPPNLPASYTIVPAMPYP